MTILEMGCKTMEELDIRKLGGYRSYGPKVAALYDDYRNKLRNKHYSDNNYSVRTDGDEVCVKMVKSYSTGLLWWRNEFESHATLIVMRPNSVTFCITFVEAEAILDYISCAIDAQEQKDRERDDTVIAQILKLRGGTEYGEV